VRQLYTDQDEVLFDAARPVILNGIEEIVTRPDLADRAVFLTLQPIPEEHRRPEQELWAAFDAERRASLVCCSTPWWWASSGCPRPGWRSCRAWLISRFGRRRARRRCGLPALFGRPIVATATRRWRA
jgi:hypothetical protein